MSITQTNPFDTEYYNSDELRRFGFNSIGENVHIAKNCTIIGLKNINIADNVRIDSGTIITANSGFFNIKSYVHIAAGCYFNANGGIILNDFSGISCGVRIYSSSDDFSGNYLTGPLCAKEFRNVKQGSVIISKHAVIGTTSVILPGCTVGVGSTVGALSLVIKNLEDWGIYCGIPCKKIKTRSKKLLQLEDNMKNLCGIIA